MIIIGGGIAGLYMAYKYHQKYPNEEVTILEKNNYIGGRVYTYNKYNINYEAGAGRFASSHKLLLKLLKEFNLDDKLISIQNSKKYIDKSEKILKKNEFNILLDKINDLIKNKKDYSHKPIKELIKTAKEKELYSNLNDHNEYYSEIEHFSAEYAYYSNYKFFIKPKFFVLGYGLSELINKLHDEVKKYTKIIKNINVSDIKLIDNVFYLTAQNAINNKDINMETDKLFLAIPNNNIKTINMSNNINLSHITKLVATEPLYRIYAKYPINKNTGKVWFHDIGKVVTNSPIKYIIPVNSNNGTIMISYTDGKYAKNMKRKTDTLDIEKYIHKEISNLFGDIPKPIWIKHHYWGIGAHYWKGLSIKEINTISEKIIKPFNDTELYIIGETYSRQQAWIEGSLETIEDYIKLY